MTAIPYPPPPKAKTANPVGVTLTADELADETGETVDRATRALPVAARVVTEYAPDAPTELLNEAVIRFGGYLLASDYGTVRREELGPKAVEYQMNHSAAFRNSGAMMLLTRYKRRRAGTI